MGNISYEFPVAKDDFERAGEASSKIKKILRQLGMDSGIIRRVAIGAYEAEMNLVIHSLGGVISITIDPESIIITAEDNGPGIEDIELAMKEGYSTAPDRIREMGFGAGMGLPNMKKCSDDFIIESVVGKGTKIVMKMMLKDGD
ncbi:ATP-binding protein [Lutispora thermophila]|uniref:Anti-sigma regulatory factor (Ser/Thr protein kinase) n=1 Tax=Lutispora thermophila DSM 19022 TaxID=1122184 RepID=A0A1M6FR65_9FIRM|nr:anti-sigma regulatory factor [Lutispora thermophila]SHJ00208.1 Anti-sigma regulatory factor (Ser/Thr protein kinase) [Lutispora thermophila DSM 19022]